MADAPSGMQNPVNIGTANAPLYVPFGSAGYNNFVSNISPAIAAGTLNQTGTGPSIPGAGSGASAITSSMALAQNSSGQMQNAYNSYLQSSAATSGMIKDATQTGATAVNAQNAASQAAIAAQVQQGQNTLSQQYAGVQQQEKNTMGAIDVALARSGPGANTDLGGINYHTAVQQQFTQSLNQIQQAQQLLTLQGTSDQQAANAKAASDLMTVAQNQIQNTMTLASQGLSAAGTVAGVQMQGAQFQMQTQQYQDQLAQQQQQQQQQNLTFNQQNGITTPYFYSGGQVYNSVSHQVVDQSQYKQLGIDPNNKDQVGQLSDQTVKQYLVNVATANPGAGVNWDANQGAVDTVASASKKIQSYQKYWAAYNAGLGSSAAPKPIGQMLTVQQASGLPVGTFDNITGTIQNYLSQHPQLWNLSTADAATVTQSKQEVFNELLNFYGSQGITSNQLQPIVDYMFAKDPNAWVSQYKGDTSKPSGLSALLGGSNLTVQGSGSGSGNSDQIDSILTSP